MVELGDSVMDEQTDRPFGPSPGPQGAGQTKIVLLPTPSMRATQSPNLVGFHPMVKEEIV